MARPEVQDLESFRLPDGFRGRPAWFVQFWWLIQGTLFAWSPQFMYGWRRWLLRLFGAQIGHRVQVRPTAEITYPWKVKIGDWSWIGDRVVIYSLGNIEIGSNAVVSQNSYLCAGTHDYAVPSFDISGPKVTIGSEVWLASDVFVGPGVTVGQGAVVGARSSVFHDLPPLKVCTGNPARPVRDRRMDVSSPPEVRHPRLE